MNFREPKSRRLHAVHLRPWAAALVTVTMVAGWVAVLLIGAGVAR